MFAAALPGEKKPTKCTILSKTVLLLNQNHMQTHILSTFSLLWLTDQISIENVGPLHKHRNGDMFFLVNSNVNNVLLQTNTDFTSHFLRARASIAIARISYGNSVCLSVRHDLVPIQD